MEIQREMSDRGQVVIPKTIRNLLGLKNRQKIVFEISGNQVVIRSKKDTHFLDDFMNVPHKLKKPLRITDIKKTLKERYEIH